MVTLKTDIWSMILYKTDFSNGSYRRTFILTKPLTTIHSWLVRPNILRVPLQHFDFGRDPDIPHSYGQHVPTLFNSILFRILFRRGPANFLAIQSGHSEVSPKPKSSIYPSQHPRTLTRARLISSKMFLLKDRARHSRKDS